MVVTVVSCLVLDILDYSYYVNILVFNLVLVVPVIVLCFELADEVFVVNLKNFVLFIFEADLNSRVFYSYEVESPYVVTFVLFQCFLVTHGQAACQVNSN